MRDVNSDRIFGFVQELKATCGFVMGDDGRQYFFLPSQVQSPYDFLDLKPRMRVTFFVFVHPRGLRAEGVTVTDPASASDSAHAQAHV